MSEGPSRAERLSAELRSLQGRLHLGGGVERLAKQHEQGKLSARERIALLTDPRTNFLEIGLLVAHDLYDGQAPAAGVVTGLGLVHSRDVVIVANDATVKAGSWWPETIGKILRAQEVAMRGRLPIVYLVDSAGVNLPYQGGVFPGQYGASRIFYYNSLMRRVLGIPQFAAVMGPCIAGGAYLPALSDVILMVDGTSFMGLGGPNLVKGATGQVVDGEMLGGSRTHVELSGVAHYRDPNDEAALSRLRGLIADLPVIERTVPAPRPPKRDTAGLAALIPEDHRQLYSVKTLFEMLFDDGAFEEFQAQRAPELICGEASIEGIRVAVIANARGMIEDPRGGPPRFGGIIYAESAEKAAFFIDTVSRRGLPILFLQDVSGFMVGKEAEHSGIIRAGARFVEAMATAFVPKIVLTINHASGAGYYAMAGQGFDPDFIFTWPTGRMGVMEGESAVVAMHGPELDRARAAKRPVDADTAARIDSTRAAYDHQLDAKFAAARGFVDAVIFPEETRPVLAQALRASLHRSHASGAPIPFVPALSGVIPPHS